MSLRFERSGATRTPSQPSASAAFTKSICGSFEWYCRFGTSGMITSRPLSTIPYTPLFTATQLRVAVLPTDAETERAAHGRAVVRREEADVLARTLRDILPVLVRGADVVEADRVRRPRLVQPAVELHRVDGAGPRLVRDLAAVQ